jgi:RNA polymerase sigma-70 factor (ECF subfamily)
MQRPTFHSLYEAYATDIFRFARFLTRSEDAAADITSETFLRAWAGRDTIRAPTARAYLFTIARNLCRDRARSARQWAPAPMPDRAVGPDAEARIELRQTLDAAAALPDAYREPLLLAASGVSFDEIGAILGISANTVKIRVHRARLKLAAAVDAAARRLT